jgi:hypothetical protein
MKGIAQGFRAMRQIRELTTLALVLPGLVLAQAAAPGGEFVYRAQAHDTLIGIGRRLLIEPRRWPEVQARNNIADPRHIPLGDEIRIPYAWLRLNADTATVMAVSGDVREGGRSVVRGQTVPEGTRIETGSDGSATLVLADGSVVTVQKLSVLTLEEMRQVAGADAAHDTRFKLESGRLQTRVKPHADVGRFEIVTPVAVSAVRGTEFRGAFEPGAGSATTETLEGSVAVSGSGTVVTVPADFGTRVTPNAAPLPPVRLLPPPDLQAIPGTNNANRLQFEWPAVLNATRYRLQLAPDAEFQSFLVDAELDTPQADLPAPPDGGYWLRVRAIDGVGLEGHDTVVPFVQQQLPVVQRQASPTPFPPAFAKHEMQLHWDPQDGMRYRVQISLDAQFSAPLLDQTLDAPTLATRRLHLGTYYARVQTIAADGSTAPFGTPVKFEIPAPLWLKLLLPALTVLAIVI